MIQRRPLSIANGELVVFERGAQCDDDADGFLIIQLGEKVDVLGRAIDKTMSDHGSAASERKRVRFGEPQCCSCDQFLQWIERHAPRLPPARPASMSGWDARFCPQLPSSPGWLLECCSG
ncbi:MAG: hypothetical protein LC775_10600 [Acidobacteria bacterium]|nr:hypothetical protein [Acidobacteriota bacterium]